MELGLTTFAEISNPGVSTGERLRQVVEEAKLAEQVGLEVYGVGEHHRPDMAASAPEIVLAAIAGGGQGSHAFAADGDGAGAVVAGEVTGLLSKTIQAVSTPSASSGGSSVAKPEGSVLSRVAPNRSATPSRPSTVFRFQVKATRSRQ